MIENCLGCQIAKKIIACPGGTVFETDNFVLNQDFDIPIKYFFIIGSKKHVQSLTDFSKDELHELILLINIIRKTIKKLFNIETTYIFQDENAPHFHIWIFPQLTWMNRIGKGIQYIPSIIEYSKKHPAKKEDIIKRVNMLREKLRN